MAEGTKMNKTLKHGARQEDSVLAWGRKPQVNMSLLCKVMRAPAKGTRCRPRFYLMSPLTPARLLFTLSVLRSRSRGLSRAPWVRSHCGDRTRCGWGQDCPSFGKQAHMSRGAGLAGGPHTGSLIFLPEITGVPVSEAAAFSRRNRRLGEAGSSLSAVTRGGEVLSRRGIVQRPRKPANKRPFPAHPPRPQPGSGNHSPFLQNNAPALLSGSPGSFYAFGHFPPEDRFHSNF